MATKNYSAQNVNSAEVESPVSTLGYEQKQCRDLSFRFLNISPNS